MRKKKVKWKDVLKEIEPGKRFNEYTRRALLADLKKAQKIIENVEHGVFPGDY